MQKHVVWKHARSPIQPSCRGPWKRRAEVGVRRGHFAPRNCPLTLRWLVRLTVEGTFSILMVSFLLKGGSRDQQKHLGICSSLTVLFLSGRARGENSFVFLCHTSFPGAFSDVAVGQWNFRNSIIVHFYLNYIDCGIDLFIDACASFSHTCFWAPVRFFPATMFGIQ